MSRGSSAACASSISQYSCDVCHVRLTHVSHLVLKDTHLWQHTYMYPMSSMYSIFNARGGVTFRAVRGDPSIVTMSAPISFKIREAIQSSYHCKFERTDCVKQADCGKNEKRTRCGHGKFDLNKMNKRLRIRVKNFRS